MDMGPIEGLNMSFIKQSPPIFIKSLRMMSDFYILPRSTQCIELGVLQKDEPDKMNKMELSKIELKYRYIKNVFLHSIKPSSEGISSYFIVIIA